MMGAILSLAAFGFGLALSAFAITGGANSGIIGISGLSVGGFCLALWLGYQWANSDFARNTAPKQP